MPSNSPRLHLFACAVRCYCASHVAGRLHVCTSSALARCTLQTVCSSAFPTTVMQAGAPRQRAGCAAPTCRPCCRAPPMCARLCPKNRASAAPPVSRFRCAVRLLHSAVLRPRDCATRCCQFGTADPGTCSLLGHACLGMLAHRAGACLLASLCSAHVCSMQPKRLSTSRPSELWSGAPSYKCCSSEQGEPLQCDRLGLGNAVCGRQAGRAACAALSGEGACFTCAAAALHCHWECSTLPDWGKHLGVL